MSEFIDRIAQIFDFAAFVQGAPMEDEVRAARQQAARDRAREALNAIRTPTAQMIETGRQTGHINPVAGHSPEPVWKAMIDEALK